MRDLDVKRVEISFVSSANQAYLIIVEALGNTLGWDLLSASADGLRSTLKLPCGV